VGIKDFKDLIVWQKAMDLAVETYELIKKLPREEVYALSSQMRRAAISIPSNIAEGNERNSTKEYINFLSIAIGSKAELETQLLLCCRFQYFTQEQAEKAFDLLAEVGKMIQTLSKNLTSNL
jgi:four helix bundle protein